MSDFFVDYIKEELCGDYIPIPGAEEDQSHNFQCSQPSELPARRVDVDVLVLLAQDEIRTIERPIQPRWSQLQWDGGQWGLGDPIPLKTECQEGKERILRPGTPSETSLSTSSDSDADMWPSVGSPSESSISAFGVDALLVESEDLRRRPNDSFLIPGSPLLDFPLSSGDDVQEQTEALTFTESASMLEYEQVPVASSCFKGPSGTQTSCLKADLPRTGKTTRKTPGRASRKKTKHSICGQPSKPSRFRVKGPKLASNNSFHHPAKPEATSQDTIPSISVPPATANQRNTTPPPELPFHHHTTNSSRSPPSLTVATECNLRTRPLIEVQLETQLVKTPPGCDTPVISTTKEHQWQPTSPPQKKAASSMRDDTSLGKRSVQLSDEDFESDTSDIQPSQKHQQRNLSNQGPPKRGKKLILDDALSGAGFVIRNGVLRCPCRMTFTRAWEAKRHWKNASTHKVQRLHEGDDSGLLENFCTKCEQFLARKDSLARHIPKCGLRKKRKCQIRMDPAGNVQLVDG